MQADGAFWYFVLCLNTRVMYITYQENGIKAGGRIVFFCLEYPRLTRRDAPILTAKASVVRLARGTDGANGPARSAARWQAPQNPG